MKKENLDLFINTLHDIIKKSNKKTIDLSLPSGMEGSRIIKIGKKSIRYTKGYDIIRNREMVRINICRGTIIKPICWGVDFARPTYAPKSKYNFNHTTHYMQSIIIAKAKALGMAFLNK